MIARCRASYSKRDAIQMSSEIQFTPLLPLHTHTHTHTHAHTHTHTHTHTHIHTQTHTHTHKHTQTHIQTHTTHSDTVSRCGVFCSFINATECCKTEGIVDVFQVVKALRIQKPGSVLTVVSMSNLYNLVTFAFTQNEGLV